MKEIEKMRKLNKEKSISMSPEGENGGIVWMTGSKTPTMVWGIEIRRRRMKNVKELVAEGLEREINNCYRGFTVTREDGQWVACDTQNTVADEHLAAVIEEIDDILAIRQDIANSIKENA